MFTKAYPCFAAFLILLAQHPDLHAMNCPRVDQATLGEKNKTLCTEAAKRDADPSIIQSLLDQGANINTQHNIEVQVDRFSYTGIGWTALMCAVCQRNTTLIQYLLQQPDIAIEATSTYAKDTALLVAIKYNGTAKSDINIIRMLLQHNTNPNAEDYLSARPLSIACEQENSALVKLLLEYGANPSYDTSGPLKPLYCSMPKT